MPQLNTFLLQDSSYIVFNWSKIFGQQVDTLQAESEFKMFKILVLINILKKKKQNYVNNIAFLKYILRFFLYILVVRSTVNVMYAKRRVDRFSNITRLILIT